MVIAMGGFAFLAVAVSILIRTWSDTAFLNHFDVAWLPLLFILSAFAFAPATVTYARLARRVPLVPLNTGLLLTFAVLTALCTLAAGSRWSAFGAILVLAVISPLVNVACWSIVLERMSSRQARRLVPLVGGASTAGAAAGGAIGTPVVTLFGVDALLWAVVVVLLLMLPLPRIVAGSWSLGRTETREPRGGLRAELRALRANPLLRTVGTATFLMAVTTNLVDFTMKAQVQASLGSPEELAVFFANFHGITNVAVLVVQLVLVTPIINRIGLGPSFALHPAVVLVGAAACVAFPGLWFATALRGFDTMLKFTFQANTQNMVITPVPLIERTQAKVFLKGMVYPLGGLAAGALIPLANLLGAPTGPMVPVFAALISGAWLWAAVKVPRSYRAQLEDNLLVEVRPGLQGEPTSPGELRQICRAHLSALSTLAQRLATGEPIDAVHDDVLRHLDEFFGTLGYLLGDDKGVIDTFERYRHGTEKARADAVELLDGLCREKGLNQAGVVLELIADRPELLVGLTPLPIRTGTTPRA